MSPTEKAKIYYNIWCCAYQRRHSARCKEDWDLYEREHQTILMCLKIANWSVFDSDKPHHLD